MIKLTMLATLVAGMALSSSPALKANALNPVDEVRDTELIVEVDRSLETLTEEGINNVQRAVFNNVRNGLTSNVRFIDSFHVLNNAFVMTINHNYVNAVKSIPGVKSVTENKIHFETTDSYIPLDDEENPDPVNDYGGSTNASAETMQKPDDTNDGEGTVIAILDNEFNFRAPTVDGDEEWHHLAFTDLADDVKVRFTKEYMTSKAVYQALHPYNSKDRDDSTIYLWRSTIESRMTNGQAGYEGSTYLNNKIPFYFDYGGDLEHRGGQWEEDFDVSSDIAYHGSHVASIASGNDPYYKGIAPKAQLVCMKVFTNRKASKTDEAMGMSSGSGAYDVPILHALEDCVLLNVDCINMSLGSNLDDFDQESITLKTLQKLADQGVLTSISAGNSGKSSYSSTGGYSGWTTDMVETGILGSYANSTKNTIIASGQPLRKFYQHAFQIGDDPETASFVEYDDQIVNRDNGTIDYDEEHKLHEELGIDAEVGWVMVPGFGADGDYAKIPGGEQQVSGKIAVVKRGSIDFATKYQNAKNKGAIAVIIINNDPTASYFNFRCSFGDVQPEIPVVLVLYRDLDYFQLNGKGTFKIIKDVSGNNPNALTVSSFSTDGARYDLELKPDVTTPGENIRGAVPPQSKSDKDYRKYSTYEFLSGTSMSAPNYAGAQSVVLSRKAKEVYSSSSPSAESLAALANYRKTVDMRLMSTAEPMADLENDPEKDRPTYASPRLQGAGMVNLEAAYNTDVYLEGKDLSGKATKSAKLSLKNINSNQLNFNFIGHNESDTAKTYSAKLTLMRPALKSTNDIVSRKYNNCGDVESINLFPGHSYFVVELVEKPDGSIEAQAVEKFSLGEAKEGDVYHVSRDIEYYATAEHCLADYDPVTGEQGTDHLDTIPVGRYVYAKNSNGQLEWQNLETNEYISTKDVVLGEYELQDVTLNAGDTEVSLSHTISAEIQDEIKSKFEYGCYLEGYVTLTEKNSTNHLNLAWLGFYTGDENTDYSNAPVVEPFAFEKLKDKSKIYPSELVNDLTKSLLGLGNVDFGSAWATTYIEPGKSYNSDAILMNNESLTHLAETDPNFHLAGTDLNGEYYDDPENNIYVGASNYTNTMIIQQFVLRSVSDNYFTIKNKASNEIVHKDVLQDMLFGASMGKWPLYKSHVDDSYLGGGYVAHRAFAVIPLYNTLTGKIFDSGEYEIEFHYFLAADGSEVTKSYSFHVDSENPSIDRVTTSGSKVRISVSDSNLASCTIGTRTMNFQTDKDGNQYVELSKASVVLALNEALNSERIGRLYVELVDKSYGRMGAIIKFEKVRKASVDSYVKAGQKEGFTEDEINTIKKGKYVPDFSNYVIYEHKDFEYDNDVKVELNGTISYFKIVNKVSQKIAEPKGIKIISSKDFPTPAASNGCGGNVSTTSITLATLAGVLAVAVMFAMRKRKLGGK